MACILQLDASENYVRVRHAQLNSFAYPHNKMSLYSSWIQYLWAVESAHSPHYTPKATKSSLF